MSQIIFFESNQKSDLDEMDITPMPSTFDVGYFKTLTSYAKRVKYCNATLKKLGAGSSRTVYIVNDGLVLKLAHNKMGLIQNKEESDSGKHNYYSDILAEVVEYATDYQWIISERAVLIRDMFLWERLTGTKFDKFVDYMNLFGMRMQGKDTSYMSPDNGLSPEIMDAYNNNDFVQELCGFIGNHRLPVGDFARLNHYGVVKRDGKERVVCIDYGITQDLINTHFNKK